MLDRKALTPTSRPSAVHHASAVPPRYRWLHDCLLKDIEKGRYPVGGAFPTEEQIASQYQVSRHTVREATRLLADNGLISRRRSLGTVVTACEPQTPPYVAALGSLKELMAHTQTTRLKVFAQESIEMDPALALTLGCKAHSPWLTLHSVRHLIGEPELGPISYTQIYLRPEYASIAQWLAAEDNSVFNLLEQRFNDPVNSVVQRIEAGCLPAIAARELDMSVSAPMLKMTRIYRDSQQQVITVSRNFYITGRFELVTQWDRTDGWL